MITKIKIFIKLIISKLLSLFKTTTAPYMLNQIQIKNTYDAMFRVVNKLPLELGIPQIASAGFLCDYETPVVYKGQFPFVRCKMICLQEIDLGITNIESMTEILQVAINQSIFSGELDDLSPQRCYIDGYPVLIVDSIFKEGNYLYIDVAIVDNQAIADYIFNKKNTKINNSIADKEDIDF